MFNIAVYLIIDSTTSSVASFAINTIANTTAGEKYLTRRQLSFKVGEGMQLTAVKDFYLSVLS